MANKIIIIIIMMAKIWVFITEIERAHAFMGQTSINYSNVNTRKLKSHYKKAKKQKKPS